jgi:decaprenyl-phosphate phosphoribosyltransferase
VESLEGPGPPPPPGRRSKPPAQRTPSRRSDISSIEAIASEEQVRFRLKEEAYQAAARARTSRGATALALVRACRPRQWSKNLLVLAAPAAAGVLDHSSVVLRVAVAFVALCLLSSATYLLNDVRDREQDRLHPRKRTRPVAAGLISVRLAVRAAVVLALLGVAAAFAVNVKLGALGIGYLALTATYSVWWRNIVVVDILAIAAGFVLRALAGGVASGVYLSRWFVLVTACCAIFLVAAKRYAELCAQQRGVPIRATLARYSLAKLRLTLGVAAAGAGIAYIGWSLTRTSHVVWYALSVVPFLLWLARYSSLVGEGAGEAPEELVLRDRALLALSGAWVALFLGGVYVGH